MNEKKKQKKGYSKSLLTQESILIWIVTISCIILAYYCVFNRFVSDLPWISTMVGFPWTAYGVSQAFYYNKSKAENTKNGITYESMVQENNASMKDIF